MRHDQIKQLLKDDPQAVAKANGLRHVHDDEPGYSRRRCGRGFSYRLDSKSVATGRTRKRLESLVIPPAWTDVWICKDPKGHLQATGIDSDGRKQYLYHPQWERARGMQKFERMVGFGHVLPRLRKAISRDLDSEGLTRERVLAGVARLLEVTLVRVGNRQYAEQNQSFGVTTLRKRHIQTENKGEGTRAVLDFAGKGGKDWHVEVEDPAVATLLEEALQVPGYEVFKYFDDDGNKVTVSAADVNDYLKHAADAEISAKDFRTWSGTVLAAMALQEIEETFPDDSMDRKLARAVETVAGELGNTTDVCKAAYIHPAVLEGFERGDLLKELARRAKQKVKRDLESLSSKEVAVLVYLEKRLERESSRHNEAA